jgi:hypothetical protein
MGKLYTSKEMEHMVKVKLDTDFFRDKNVNYVKFTLKKTGFVESCTCIVHLGLGGGAASREGKTNQP